MIYTFPQLDNQETDVLGQIDEMRKETKFILQTPARWFGNLRRSAFARAIQGSNSIEGYDVTVEDAIAAAEGEQPLNAEGETWAAIVGYRNAMTYVLRLSKDPHFSYSDGIIKSLHFMMVQHDLSKFPGSWRPGAIYVRNDKTNKIVYEGPSNEIVPELMQELVKSLNKSSATPATIRAAMAHLNLTMIHPFKDGNGRMARCLQSLVLGREGVLEPEFSSIEEYLGRNTQDYYDVLSRVGQGNWHPTHDARPWIRFCLTAHYRQAQTIAQRVHEIQKVWDELEIELKKRGLPYRCIFALADATNGWQVRNSTYRTIAEISENLASRDLKTLVDKELLISTGEKRGRVYVAAPILQDLRKRTKSLIEVDDPFQPKPATATMLPGFG
jgi:Fic family protein